MTRLSIGEIIINLPTMNGRIGDFIIKIIDASQTKRGSQRKSIPTKFELKMFMKQRPWMFKYDREKRKWSKFA